MNNTNVGDYSCVNTIYSNLDSIHYQSQSGFNPPLEVDWVQSGLAVFTQ